MSAKVEDDDAKENSAEVPDTFTQMTINEDPSHGGAELAADLPGFLSVKEDKGYGGARPKVRPLQLSAPVGQTPVPGRDDEQLLQGHVKIRNPITPQGQAKVEDDDANENSAEVPDTFTHMTINEDPSHGGAEVAADLPGFLSVKEDKGYGGARPKVRPLQLSAPVGQTPVPGRDDEQLLQGHVKIRNPITPQGQVFVAEIPELPSPPGSPGTPEEEYLEKFFLRRIECIDDEQLLQGNVKIRNPITPQGQVFVAEIPELPSPPGSPGTPEEEYLEKFFLRPIECIVDPGVRGRHALTRDDMPVDTPEMLVAISPEKIKEVMDKLDDLNKYEEQQLLRKTHAKQAEDFTDDKSLDDLEHEVFDLNKNRPGKVLLVKHKERMWVEKKIHRADFKAGCFNLWGDLIKKGLAALLYRFLCKGRTITLTMEYLQGETLETIIKNFQLDREDSRDFALLSCRDILQAYLCIIDRREIWDSNASNVIVTQKLLALHLIDFERDRAREQQDLDTTHKESVDDIIDMVWSAYIGKLLSFKTASVEEWLSPLRNDIDYEVMDTISNELRHACRDDLSDPKFSAAIESVLKFIENNLPKGKVLKLLKERLCVIFFPDMYTKDPNDKSTLAAEITSVDEQPADLEDNGLRVDMKR